MSRNAFAQCERDYNEAEERRDNAMAERASVNPIITDADRVKWMAGRIDYVEHRNRDGIKCAQVKTGQYWPQCEDEDPADPDMIGLSLVEYIDAQIKKEREA